MDIVILGLLMIRDLTIYQLNQAFNSGIALIYSASYGSLLSAIKKLLLADEITYIELIENGRNKKIYHVTEKGRIHFNKWMRDDISDHKLETMALCKVFFLGLIGSADEKRKILYNIIYEISKMEATLGALSQSLSQLQLSVQEQKIYNYQFKTLDYGLRSHQVAREWAQQILDELKE
jgi:DNA-binding PadR family transcriptional regulator